MTGGTISGNHVSNNDSGGAVYSYGSFVMTGGSITGNYVPWTNNSGGGVGAYGGSVTLGGSAVIEGNYKYSSAYPCDLSVSNAMPIRFGDGTTYPAPTQEMRIGVHGYAWYDDSKPFTQSGDDVSAFYDCFFADQADHYLSKREGRLALCISAPEEGEGYSIDYKNGRIIVAEGYEISLTPDPDFAPMEFTFDEAWNQYVELTYDAVYCIRREKSNTHDASPSTQFTTPKRPPVELHVLRKDGNVLTVEVCTSTDVTLTFCAAGFAGSRLTGADLTTLSCSASKPQQFDLQLAEGTETWQLTAMDRAYCVVCDAVSALAE